jgi:hypothetical protein
VQPEVSSGPLPAASAVTAEPLIFIVLSSATFRSGKANLRKRSGILKATTLSDARFIGGD